MYFRSYPDKNQLHQQVSAIITSARSSFSSLPGRRNSSNSVISFADRRASFQLGMKSSDISDKSNNTKSSSANNVLFAKKGVTFSPIHEHNEELLDSDMPQEHAHRLMTCLDPASIKIIVLSEEPKAIFRTYHFKCTEV